MNIIKKMNSKKHYYRVRYGLVPTKEQLEVINATGLYEKSFARQMGTSTACILKAYEFAINNPNRTVRFFGMSQQMAEIHFNMAHVLNQRSSFLSKITNTIFTARREKIIQLSNNSTIHFHDGRDPRELRGLRADCIITDQGRFLDQQEKVRFHQMIHGSKLATLIILSQSH